MPRKKPSGSGSRQAKKGGGPLHIGEKWRWLVGEVEAPLAARRRRDGFSAV